MRNNLVFPLDNLMKTDMKDKSEMKKSMDKSVKDYDAKFSKLEKELKHQAKEAGFSRAVNHRELADRAAARRGARGSWGSAPNPGVAFPGRM